MGRTTFKRTVAAIGIGVLLCGTVMVFLAFDRNSHSASDTLRPFILSTAPVWVIAVAAVRSWLRSS